MPAQLIERQVGAARVEPRGYHEACWRLVPPCVRTPVGGREFWRVPFAYNYFLQMVSAR